MKRISAFTIAALVLVGLVSLYLKTTSHTDSNKDNSLTNQAQDQIEKIADQFYGSQDPPPASAAYVPEKARFSQKNNNLFAKNKVDKQTETSKTEIYSNERDEDQDNKNEDNILPFSASSVALNNELANEDVLAGLPEALNKPVAKADEQNEIFGIPTLLKKPTIIKGLTKESEEKTNLSNNSTGTPSNTSTTLTCTSDITSGTFNHPVAVNITCNAAATIKYCLAEGSCCDPVTSGTIYTGAIAIGQSDGNFCLSYYGGSDIAGSSDSQQQLYQINPALPDLQVAHTKQFYQTTELPDLSYITSNDFGKAGYEIGQVNLKEHDPGISGLNMDCDEIVNNHSSLTSPDALITQIFMDVSGLNPSMQVEIPLHPTQLHYNDNYVTSYIVNNNFATPLYSCATTLVRLNDFDFFASDDISGDAGTNQVREFTAGFTPYGFFEEEATTYRGPAGVSNSTVADQHLETGLIEIFF